MVLVIINIRDIVNNRYLYIRYMNCNFFEVYDVLDLVKMGMYFLIILMFEDVSKCCLLLGSEVFFGEILVF